MSIRSAALEDWQGISRLLTQLEYPGTEDFLQVRLAGMLRDPAETLLVWAEPLPTPAGSESRKYSDQTILGLLSLHFIPQVALRGDFARISYFAVDDGARSLGIGRKLEEMATQLAKERGCALMEVHCHTRRTRAHEFYSRQGWVESPKYLIKRL
jgi:GNAT superfamily N-acetyltransferase